MLADEWRELERNAVKQLPIEVDQSEWCMGDVSQFIRDRLPEEKRGTLRSISGWVTLIGLYRFLIDTEA